MKNRITLVVFSSLLCSLSIFAAQEAKHEAEQVVAAPAVVNPKKGIKPKIAYKIQLLGKLQVITKDLKQAARSFNNKFARGIISTLVDDMGKVTPEQDASDMLEALDQIAENLNKIKDPKFINQKELKAVDKILAKADALKSSYQKDINLSHLQRANEKFDLSEVEMFTQEPFMDLILAQQGNKLPYIIARVMSDNSPSASYFDAHALNKYIFNEYPIYPNAGKWELDGPKMRRKEGIFGFRQTLNPLNRNPLTINNIDYFVINSLKDNEFKYLASFNDLINIPHVQNMFYKNSGMVIPLQLQPSHILPHEGSVNSVAISPNNQFVVTGSQDGAAKIWNAQTGLLSKDLAVGDPINSVAISLNNQFVVTGFAHAGPDNGVAAEIWDVQSGVVSHMLLHNGYVSSLAISPNNQFVVTGSYDKTAKIWNAQSGNLSHTLNHDREVLAVAISPNDHFVVTGMLSTNSLAGDAFNAFIWDAQTGNLLHPLSHNGYVSSLAISPNNQFVVAGSGSGVAKIWNLQTGALLHSLIHDGEVNVVAISSNNQFVVTGSADNTAKIWNAQTGMLLHTLGVLWLRDGAVFSVAMSPDDKFVVIGHFGRKAQIYDMQTGALLYTLPHDGAVGAVAVSPNSKFVVTGSNDKTAKIWAMPE